MKLTAKFRTKTSEGGEGAGHPPSRAEAATGRSDDARFEDLLERALRIDVPPTGTVKRRPRVTWEWTRMALAAAVVLAVGLTFSKLQDAAYFGSDDLASDVMAHVRHEPAALVSTREAVSPAALDKVLQSAGARLASLDRPVTYIKLCPFRGQMVAHMAVQGQNGPVIVILLPEENVDVPMPIDEDGFVGTIVPLGAMGGSFAVVGEYAGDLQSIKDQVADAVRWRL